MSKLSVAVCEYGTAQTVTASGAVVSARLSGSVVVIEQDGREVGRGRWTGTRIDDCAARLGAPDGSETEDAYDALDRGLAELTASAD